MRRLTHTLLLLLITLSTLAVCDEPSPVRAKTLYTTLDPRSIAQHLAFYELYPGTHEGQLALRDAYRLLSGNNQLPSNKIHLPANLSSSVNAIVGLVNKLPSETQIDLTDEELDCINRLADRLLNRRFKGYHATSEEQVLALKPYEVDLARGVLLSQLGNDPAAMKAIKRYEAAIDLMALQILTRIDFNTPPKEKIRAINEFIFVEMGFRFPPHSTYAKDVDLYTFLPSVLDSHKGVCLGVSILYICLAQRLGLELEIVTPPGHIFVCWTDGKEEVNIETTARGINVPTEEYLGVDTRSLQKRNVKETIGMAHFNQASVYWERGLYDKVVASYRKAKPYMPDDKLLTGLMGFACVVSGNVEEGRKCIAEVTNYTADFAVSKDTLAEDYINGAVDEEGMKAVFKRVDDTRNSLVEKRLALEAALRKSPRFREGLFSLAGTWLQLHRTGEALEVLKRYHALDPTNASVEYYLAELYKERMDYNNAWQHLRNAERLTKERDHEPVVLLEFTKELCELCPE